MNQERYTDRVEIGKANDVSVYLVRDTGLGRDVELHVWQPAGTAEPDAAEKFMRAALLRARLEHPGIPAVLDNGDWPGGGRYYTLQLARGTAFSTLLKHPARQWPAPPLRIAAEACRALAHAHQRGVVHANLSAENVIVAPDGAVYVDGWENAQPASMGEGLDGGDPRGDVYALGSLLGLALRMDKVRDAAPMRELIHRATSPAAATRPEDGRALLAALQGRMALDVPAGPRKRRRPRRLLAAAAIALAVAVFGVAAAAAVALWPQSREHVPWIGEAVYNYLRDRQPDSELGRWFEDEHKPDTSEMTAYAAEVQFADRAIGLRSFNRARGILEQTAPENRHWEWGFLVHRANLDAVTFDPEIGMVFSLAFSPDGKWLAVSGSNRRVQLYHWPSGEFAGDLDGHSGRVMHAEFTPDSEMLLTTSDDHAILVWDVARQKLRDSFNGHASRVWALEQLPEGVAASASWDANISLWKIDTSAEIGRLAAPEGVWAMALAPDQRRLYAGAYDGTFLIYDLNKRWPQKVHHDASNFMTDLDVRSDGQEVAAAYFDPVIRLLDAEGRVQHELHGHDDAIWNVTYSHDNSRIISSSRDGTARIWDAESHKELAVLEGHDSEVNSVALDPEENWLLTASDDGTIKGWRARSWLAGWSPHRSFHSSEIEVDLMAPVALASNGRWAAAGMKSGEVLVWVPRGREQRHRILPAMNEQVTALALDANQGLLAAGGEDGAVVLWSSRSGDVVRRFSELEAGVTALEFSPDGGVLYAGGHDQQVRYWDLESGDPGSMGNHHDSITTIAVSPDGETVASGSLDETVRIWRGRSIYSVLRQHRSFVSALAFSPTGQYLASGGADHQIFVWQVRSDEVEPLALGAHNSVVKALAFSADGRRLLAAVTTALSVFGTWRRCESCWSWRILVDG